MIDPATVLGTFSDHKTFKTRGVLVLMIEVPIEKADLAMAALGGIPQPGAEKWVAVARIEPEAAEKAARTQEPTVTKPPGKPWADHTAVAQAAMRCNDPVFQEWCWDSAHQVWHDDQPIDLTIAESAATWIREQCGVTSRSELLPDTPAEAKWRAIDARFVEESGRMAERR